MSIYTEASGAFFEASDVSMIGQSCTISGISCTAVFAATQADNVFADFSTRENVSLTCVVSKTLITSAPADRSAVVKGTQTFYVHRVDESPTHFTLYLRQFE